MDAVHQFIPSFARWDAISAHVRHLQRLVRQLGLSSEIYCDSAHAVAPGEAHYYRDFRADRSAGRSWLLYQLSTGSRVAHFLQGRPEPKVVNYHNITPAEVFGP